ncbi:hypothetical protein J1605_020550 [Eschrichtius robustus]|uniref:Bromo domain-containing protein n=1 Tax=Eschrichtius robustus TaxID=9764 RepID=A0AB34HIA0_ESCRO|nr:hypothetical protein J1605_020550 [Eschrichtius robustus]
MCSQEAGTRVRDQSCSISILPHTSDPPWSLSSAILQSLLGVRACGVCWGGCGSCLSRPAVERARPPAHPDAPSGGRASPVRSLVALGQHGCPALLGQGHSLCALLLLASASGAEVAVPQGLTPLVTSGESGEVRPLEQSQRLKPFCAEEAWASVRSCQQVPAWWGRRVRGERPALESCSRARENDEEIQAAKEKLKYWQRLRHDLERARLLIELLRKREKLKREQVKVEQMALELRLTPLTVLLRSVLDQLQEKDPARIFAQPVSLKEVPDYLDHIKHPMDFATMRKRLEAQGYRTLGELEEDFDLIVDNCMKYNAKDTVFYRAAVRLRDQGGAVLRQARRQADGVGFEQASGMHLPERPPAAPRRPFSWDDVDRLLNPANRAHLVLEEQLRELLDMLDLTCAMKSSGSRSKRAKLLKKEIAVLRNKLSQQHSQPPAAESGTAGFEEDGAQLGQETGEEGKHARGRGPGALGNLRANARPSVPSAPRLGTNKV